MSKISNFSLLAYGILLPIVSVSTELAYSAMPNRVITMHDKAEKVMSSIKPFQQLWSISGMQISDRELLNTVSYAIDTNVNTVNSMCNNEYWGIQNPYKLSITNLKKLITVSRNINVRKQIASSLSKDLISVVRKNQAWREVKKERDQALSLMTDFLIYETLLQCQNNPQLAVTLSLNLDTTSERRLYAVLYRSAYKQVCEQLLANGMRNTEFVFEEEQFKEFANETPAKYFKHDWNCYLNQFKVIHSGVVANKDKKIWINSVLSTVNTLNKLRNQCVQRIRALNPKAKGSTNELITAFEKSDSFKKALVSVNGFVKTEILNPDHNNLDYLIFLCNFYDLQLCVNNKKLKSIDTVINIWQNLIKNVNRNLQRPPQNYLADLHLIMSMSAISAFDYKMEVNEKNIKNIIDIFNQIQEYGVKLSGHSSDTFTGCHLAISLLKYGIKPETFLSELLSTKQKLSHIHFKTTCYLALLSCIANNDRNFKTFGSAVELYKTIEKMSENSAFSEQIVINCINFWKQGNLPEFVQKFNKVKCVFTNIESIKKYYKGNIDSDGLESFYLYVTTYGFKMGNPANYFTNRKFINTDITAKTIDTTKKSLNNIKTIIKKTKNDAQGNTKQSVLNNGVKNINNTVVINPKLTNKVINIFNKNTAKIPNVNKKLNITKVINKIKNKNTK